MLGADSSALRFFFLFNPFLSLEREILLAIFLCDSLLLHQSAYHITLFVHEIREA
jgi:hypothetical protein